MEGEANDCLYSTLVAEQAEKGSTGGFSDGVSSPMSAWLDNAGRRFSDTEVMVQHLESFCIQARLCTLCCYASCLPALSVAALTSYVLLILAV